MSDFNVLDLLILVIIIASALMGLLRGFVKEALSVGAWIISTWVAVAFGDELSAVVSAHVDNKILILIISYGGLFFGTLIFSTIINFLISNVVKMTGFTFTDRMMGILFGILRGVVFIAILALAAKMLSFDDAHWWSSSEYIKYFNPISEWLHQFVPDNLEDVKNVKMPELSIDKIKELNN
ncbi:MAG: CvpA family protein [Legionellales bacterium]|nr:CvpA family protein [Legionellales bacterium]